MMLYADLGFGTPAVSTGKHNTAAAPPAAIRGGNADDPLQELRSNALKATRGEPLVPAGSWATASSDCVNLIWLPKGLVCLVVRLARRLAEGYATVGEGQHYFQCDNDA